MSLQFKFDKYLKNVQPEVVLIFAKYNGKWLFCRHKKRITYEICGGHIEKGEIPLQTAQRELYEESGAIAKTMTFKGYVTKIDNHSKQTMAIFFAEITSFDKLPNYEMEEIKLFDFFPQNTTYPETYDYILNLKGLI